MTGRRIRVGMVGGGAGSFIGAVHRNALRLDDEFELVAGALSSDPQRNQQSASELRLDTTRAYSDYRAMAVAEAERSDGIDVVVIVTPNHLHVPVAQAFIEQGIHVICDKPMATSLADADRLHDAVSKSGLLFLLTHTYVGYPMVRHARDLVKSGDIGEVRIVQVEYAQDWLSEPLEQQGNKQAEWRNDPLRAGPAGALGDIGTHAFHLAGFVSGLNPNELCADLTSFGKGRQLDDHVHVMLRYPNGARGMLWASQVAVGARNALRLRVFGTRGSLAFDQESPEYLWLSQLGRPQQQIWRGTTPAAGAAANASRLPPGHPEGYFEALAQLYRDFATSWRARGSGSVEESLGLPGIDDGRRGMAFIEAVLCSHQSSGRWTALS